MPISESGESVLWSNKGVLLLFVGEVWRSAELSLQYRGRREHVWNVLQVNGALQILQRRKATVHVSNQD